MNDINTVRFPLFHKAQKYNRENKIHNLAQTQIFTAPGKIFAMNNRKEIQKCGLLGASWA